ncbi:MAG: amino acid adenylation domain-containing protein, partial [Gammaproteobacteria bacterium]|nr:amino acid adenylation domain-containing protein [Gammaproteobacteria bacterium]
MKKGPLKKTTNTFQTKKLGKPPTPVKSRSSSSSKTFTKNKKLKSKKIQKKSDYWQNLLTEFSLSSKLWLEGFGIPSAPLGAKPIKHTYSNETKTFSIKSKNIKDITPILHAAWAILLNRYTGSDDIVYGSAILDSLNNTKKITIKHAPIPVRSTIRKGDTLQTFIKHLKHQLEQNQKHTSHFYNDEAATQQADNLINYLFLSSNSKINSKKSLHLTVHAQKYPLVFVAEQKKLLKIQLYYDNARFTKNSIKNIISHLIFIIKQINLQLKKQVTHFSILLPEEKIKLKQWGKPSYNQLITNTNPCCHELFINQALLRPQNLAVADNNYELNYKQLHEVSNQLAHFLVQQKVSIGDPVAVLMERTPAIIVAMLAIFKIGAIYVPINPKYPDERIQYVLSDCKPNIILANNTQRIPTEYLEKTHILDDQYDLLESHPIQTIARHFSSKELAYIIYTSGTTGQPKGVMIKHESLTNLAIWYQTCFSLSAKDRASQFASSGFDTFFCETVPCLVVGASIHIIEDNAKLTPGILLPWLAKKDITICDLPTSYAQILFSVTWPKNLNLHTVKLGGESLTQYPNQIYPFDIWNIYGPTEATVECTFMKIYNAHSSLEMYENKQLPPPIGKPIINSEMYIVDQHLEPVPIGNVGELLIGGIIISTGYLNRESLTDEKFIKNIFSTDPESRLYRTGDLVRWLDDGNIEFVGRIDNQVKIRGYRIELSEIETTIRQYPDVAEVVVLAKEIVSGQKTLIAYLVPNIDKIRIPYQEKCLINLNDVRYIEVISVDISKEGIAVTGLTENIEPNTHLRINIKLPGTGDGQWLSGKLMWQIDQRAGVVFDKTEKQMTAMNKCIEYYLATHNLMETIENAASKRNIRKAIKMKLPEYMVPSVFCILPQFPLTFNGKIAWKALPPPKDFERLLERQFVGPRTETEKEIMNIWCNILNIKNASMTDSFFDLGGNSLMISQLSVKIMNKFNLSIPMKIFIDLPFIPILAEYIESRGEKYTFKSTIQEEIIRDAILNADILPLKTMGDIKHPGGILLTGVSGFLGIYLLRELLQKTEAKIYCLIRKGEFESTAKRLVNTVEQYHLTNEILLSNRRIILLDGDIGYDRFGLSTQQYNSLSETVDTIYHCGAQVNTMASYSNLRSSNVQGTIEVIKFATKSIDKAIHYISTLSAAVKLDTNNCYAEEFPDADSTTLIGGYAISKWVSERLLTQIKSRGLPVSIYRSGHILGQTDNGVTSVNNSLLYLIKGCIQLGYAPDWKENITFLPVDFASAAIINISLYHPEISAVYHLDHPNGIMWTDLVAWLQQYGYRIDVCSYQDWRQRLTTIGPDNALFPFLPLYLADEDLPITPSTSMQTTISILNAIDFPFPEI